MHNCVFWFIYPGYRTFALYFLLKHHIMYMSSTRRAPGMYLLTFRQYIIQSCPQTPVESLWIYGAWGGHNGKKDLGYTINLYHTKWSNLCPSVYVSEVNIERSHHRNCSHLRIKFTSFDLICKTLLFPYQVYYWPKKSNWKETLALGKIIGRHGRSVEWAIVRTELLLKHVVNTFLPLWNPLEYLYFQL